VRRLIQMRPDLAEAHYNLAGMLYSKDQFDEAIAEYNRALQLKPDYEDARRNLEVVLRTSGRAAASPAP